MSGTGSITLRRALPASSAASVPVSLDFTFPSTSLTLEVERTNFNVATCSALQIDNVYLTEKDWINENFATLDNTSGYSANTGSNVVLSNTNQSLQIAPTLLSASNGIRKNIDLEAGTEYTFSYDIAAQTPLSNKNYILCELFYGTNALYSYKIMSTQSNSFVYTPTSSGTYTWRFRRVCTGATAPASSYTVDNLKVSYVIPYTRTECPETDLAYRFGFNTQEKDDEVYGAGMLQLPQDDNNVNSKFTAGSQLVYTVFNRNDENIRGKVETDGFGSTSNIATFINIAVGYKSETGGTLSYGDLSTSNGGSPMFWDSKKGDYRPHKSHFSGSQIDIRYMDGKGNPIVGLGNASANKASVKHVQSLLNNAWWFGANFVVLGNSLNGKVSLLDGKTSFNSEHNNHIHLGIK